MPTVITTSRPHRRAADDRTRWRFVLEITEPPDPQIPVVLGDCLFNVRCALDELAVACMSGGHRDSARFPIVLNTHLSPGRALRADRQH